MISQRGTLDVLVGGLPAARRVLEMLLALVAGLLVARLIWLIAEPGGAVTKPIPFASVANTSATDTSAIPVDLMILSRANYFGAAPAGPSVIPDAPETSLNLHLKGVRAIPESRRSDQPSETSIAIIQTPDNKALTYRRGDTIIDGVTLDRILPDRVLIMKGGALETLMMQSSASALSVLLVPGQEGIVEGSQSTNQQAALLNAPRGNFLTYMDFEPVLAEGIVTGYRVKGRGSESSLTALGLQTGDVVVQIAGDRIADVDGQSLLAQLGTATEIDLTVERGGALQTVTLRIPKGE